STDKDVDEEDDAPAIRLEPWARSMTGGTMVAGFVILLATSAAAEAPPDRAVLVGYQAAPPVVAPPRGERGEVKLVLVEEGPPPSDFAPTRSTAVVLAGVAATTALLGVALTVDAVKKASAAQIEGDAIRAAGHRCVLGAASFDARCGHLLSTVAA